MTTLYKMKTRCALCGNKNEFTAIGSTNTFGSPDLDTRPPEMGRSTIFTWVQRCTECGYCATDVSKSNPVAEAVVKGQEYRRHLNNHAYPESANSFRCKAIIDLEAGNYVGATWALVHAAWVCDDADRPDEAMVCRYMAADMLVTAEKHGQQIAKQNGASTTILVDLLRRSGRTEDARRAITERRSQITEDIIIRILEYQSDLIEKDDKCCHTISEAIEKEGGK